MKTEFNLRCERCGSYKKVDARYVGPKFLEDGSEDCRASNLIALCNGCYREFAHNMPSVLKYLLYPSEYMQQKRIARFFPEEAE